MAAALPLPDDCCNSACCDDVTETSLDSAINTIVGTNMKFDTIAALRATASLFPIAIVLGGAAAGDGGGGIYYYDATSTAADDGISVIDPTGFAGAGRYLKLM